MKRTVYSLLFVTLFAYFVIGETSLAASARCEVVQKQGNILVMDCGDRATGFDKKSRVKIKTDRDRKNRQD